MTRNEMLKKSQNMKSKKSGTVNSHGYEDEEDENFVQSPESEKLHKIQKYTVVKIDQEKVVKLENQDRKK